MNLILNLTDEQRAFAESEWKKVVEDKQTETTTVEDWMQEIFTPFFQGLYDKKAAEAANSWKPVESPDVAIRKEQVTQQLQAVSEETLKKVEDLIAGKVDVNPIKEKPTEEVPVDPATDVPFDEKPVEAKPSEPAAVPFPEL